jgi:hypothetical protein
VELVTSAVITWQRTGLPFATAGMAAGAVASIMLVGLNLAGYPWPPPSAAASSLPPAWEVPVVALLLVCPVTYFAQARANRAAWRQWREHMERQGLWDLLRFRHVPVLQKRPGPGA